MNQGLASLPSQKGAWRSFRPKSILGQPGRHETMMPVVRTELGGSPGSAARQEKDDGVVKFLCHAPRLKKIDLKCLAAAAQQAERKCSGRREPRKYGGRRRLGLCATIALRLVGVHRNEQSILLCGKPGAASGSYPPSQRRNWRSEVCSDRSLQTFCLSHTRRA